MEVSLHAKTALVLEERLSSFGVHLRLPFSPFNADFDEEIEAERCFRKEVFGVILWVLLVLVLGDDALVAAYFM